jgi:hypothetical protein
MSARFVGADSTANIRRWWEARPPNLPLPLRARFATLLIRCEQLEGALRAARWYVEVYDTPEHNSEQRGVLERIDTALPETAP